MLTYLTVSKLVLIDKAEMGFDSGFTVFTGETGAGKSILLDALSLALGKRADIKLIKKDAGSATVTAVFDISSNSKIKKIFAENDLEKSDEMILRRVLTSDGKSRAFINDSPVSINLLKTIAENLLEIHGQHENNDLMLPALHLAMLDDFMAKEKLLKEVLEKFNLWQEAQKKLEIVSRQIEKIKQEEDYLRHIYSELKNLKPIKGEEEKLAEQRKILMNREKFSENVNYALSELKSNKPVSESINHSVRILSKSTGDFSKVIESLENASAEIEQAVMQLEKFLSDMESAENSLEDIDDRYFALKEAARKYRRTVDELPEYIKEVEQQLSLIDSDDSEFKRLQEDALNCKNNYYQVAKKLSEARKESAVQLEEKIKSELEPLKMSGSQFKVLINENPQESWSINGIDRVNFLVRTNAGNEFGAINKIASGGELSRFMLALKVVMLSEKSVPTMIFDEIDSGIGGAVADAVGKRLQKLGKKIQVMAVTHLPQVAAYGNEHFLIQKTFNKNDTNTIVRKLSAKERQEELARMLAGEKITEQARAAASALIEAK